MKRFYFISSKVAPNCSPNILSFDAAGPLHRLFLSLKCSSWLYLPGEYSLFSTRHSSVTSSRKLSQLAWDNKITTSHGSPQLSFGCACLSPPELRPLQCARLPLLPPYPVCPPPRLAQRALEMLVSPFSIPWHSISIFCMSLIPLSLFQAQCSLHDRYL